MIFLPSAGPNHRTQLDDNIFLIIIQDSTLRRIDYKISIVCSLCVAVSQAGHIREDRRRWWNGSEIPEAEKDPPAGDRMGGHINKQSQGIPYTTSHLMKIEKTLVYRLHPVEKLNLLKKASDGAGLVVLPLICISQSVPSFRFTKVCAKGVEEWRCKCRDER